MAIDLDDVRKISRLARIPLGSNPEDSADGESQAEAWIEQLGAIIDYFDQLADFPADQEPEPDSSGDSRLAADVACEALPRHQFEANAPEARDGFLVVPKVKANHE